MLIKYCRVWNVKGINVTDFYLNFNTTSDHSKWAVSDLKNNWICVGDINREVCLSFKMMVIL